MGFRGYQSVSSCSFGHRESRSLDNQRRMHTMQDLCRGALAGTRRLDLSCGLTELPLEVQSLADSLEVLNLRGNHLSALPPWLPRLRKLKVIFCSDNPFTELPEVLGECAKLEMVGFKACHIERVPSGALPPALRWLILTDNCIEALPAAIGERPQMQKLMLAGNRLTALPEGLAQAQRLELLRISANRFERLPPWLTELPRLSWLALAGNPLGWGGVAHELPSVSWNQLTLGERLGEGASGETFRVEVKGWSEPMALKLFKGAVTSDGLPEHEVQAGARIGLHPGLCTPVAALKDHPDGVLGMLLPLLPSGLRLLAGPPSLDSCTRDVYSEGLQLAPQHALRLLSTVAEAMTHLHRQSMIHGDLYAHNILCNPSTGDAVLSDMGAAAALPSEEPDLVRAVQALEVRAFGCLLEELGDVLDVTPGDSTRDMMLAWAGACMVHAPSERPTMAEVSRLLNKELG